MSRDPPAKEGEAGKILSQILAMLYLPNSIALATTKVVPKGTDDAE
jgi:hypothetical protein